LVFRLCIAMPAPELVVGLAGRIGSGKSVAGRYIARKYGGEIFRFSDVLSDILRRLGLECSRENYINLGSILRHGFGNGVIAEALRMDILRSGARVAVVDGVRYPEEVEMVRSFENSLIIYIHAEEGVRYRRTVERGEKAEAGESYEQFLLHDSAETERMLSEVRRMADAVIDNSGSVEELYARLDERMKLTLGR